MSDVLEELAAVLESRKSADPGKSYVASLYAGGTPAILAKVKEEAAEVGDAGGAGDDAALVHEVADLWFHTLVLLAHRGLGPGRVLAELGNRFGRSGLDEKAGRLRK
jgi:phosphoribosyl-ATP pyrophosphohydrolase